MAAWFRKFFTTHRKAGIAWLGFLATTVATIVAAKGVPHTTAQWSAIGTSLLVALLVHLLPNAQPPVNWDKAKVTVTSPTAPPGR